MAYTPTEKAVHFAAEMMRKGKYMGSAVNIAANYYKVDRKDVQSGLSARSGRSQVGRKRADKPERTCENCGKGSAIWRGKVYHGFNTFDFFTCTECGKHPPRHFEAGDCGDRIVYTKYTPTKTRV